MWLSPGSNGGLHYDSYDNSCSVRYANIFSNYFLSTNTWYLVIWIKTETTYKFYRDDNLFQTAVAPASFYRTASSYWIGRVDNFWNGLIDEVRIYNRALSDSEIKAIYEATR